MSSINAEPSTPVLPSEHRAELDPARYDAYSIEEIEYDNAIGCEMARFLHRDMTSNRVLLSFPEDKPSLPLFAVPSLTWLKASSQNHLPPNEQPSWFTMGWILRLQASFGAKTEPFDVKMGSTTTTNRPQSRRGETQKVSIKKKREAEDDRLAATWCAILKNTNANGQRMMESIRKSGEGDSGVRYVRFVRR